MKKVIVTILLVIAAVVTAGCGGGNETAAKNLFVDYLKLEEHCLNTGDVPDKTVMFEKYFWEGSRKSSYHGEQGWTDMVRMANKTTAGNVKVEYDVVDVESHSVMDKEKDVRTAEQAARQLETGLTDLQEVTATVKITLSQGSEKKTVTHQYKALVCFINNPKRAFISEIVMVR